MKLSNVLLKCSKVKFSRLFLIILVLSFAVFHLSTQDANAGQATLTWTAPTNYVGGAQISDFVGYNLHIGTTSGNYNQVIDVGTQTSYTVANLTDGTTYYFAVTAYDSLGNESGYSSEVNNSGQTTQPSSSLYTITAGTGSGGSITPSGSVIVSQGASQSFTITPSPGYTIAGVTVDGVSVGTVSTYTFSNVTANHTISASFSAATSSSSNIPQTNWTLKYVDSQELVGQNGAATNAFDGQSGTMWVTQWYNVTSPPPPHEIQINLGQQYSLNGFSYLPRQDGQINGTIGQYEFYVSTDGVNWGTPVATGTFTNDTLLKQVSFAATNGQYIRLRALSEVNGGPWTAAAEINVTGTAASTTATNYAISANAGTGGSISPSGTTTVNSGGSQTYTITPASGYTIAGVTVDGVSVGAVSTYTFSNVTASHTIAATFSANVTSYAITASAGTGGSISPSGTTTVNSGGSQTYTINPASPYKIAGVSVDGLSVGAVSSYTFSNVTASHTISATFVKGKH